MPAMPAPPPGGRDALLRAAGLRGVPRAVPRVARSRAVHEALAAEFAGGLHALALTLRTPAEQAQSAASRSLPV